MSSGDLCVLDILEKEVRCEFRVESHRPLVGTTKQDESIGIIRDMTGIVLEEHFIKVERIQVHRLFFPMIFVKIVLLDLTSLPSRFSELVDRQHPMFGNHHF